MTRCSRERLGWSDDNQSEAAAWQTATGPRPYPELEVLAAWLGRGVSLCGLVAAHALTYD